MLRRILRLPFVGLGLEAVNIFQGVCWWGVMMGEGSVELYSPLWDLRL
jgi:hypothetical protein